MDARPALLAALALSAASCAVPAPAAAHDWYEGLSSPGGEPCCTDRDCQAVDHRLDPATRRLEVGIEGVWVPVDPARLVSVPSPDGAAHACFERRWTRNRMTPVVRCVILPGEA